ncbi:MAG: NAD(P)/FAD-dependent oxidoreductase [Clostridiales Family XIII bacterium]|jgi:prolycopene isomerase|nr:NAD(P)/FAD-dependent oxidoreductase [Clostridiales Family XIII bacterium]
MAKSYDVVVIGAGNGGLVAGLTAALNGLKVLVVEQHNLPGGAASSFVRGRFEFEPAIHEMSRVGTKEEPGQLRSMMDALGINIDWVRVPEAYHLVVKSEGIDEEMPFGVKEFIEKMEYYHPGSAGKMQEFIALCIESLKAFGYLQGVRDKYDRAYLEENFPNFLQVATLTIDEVFEAVGLPEDVRINLSTYWSYLGLSTDKEDFMLFCPMLMGYLTNGAYVPPMRSHEVSAKMEKRIVDAGGEIWFNTLVEKIIMEDGHVAGVVTNRGEVRAKEVIANCSPHVVFGSMLDPKYVPEDEIRLANARHYDFSVSIVYLGLNKSMEELGIKDYTVFFQDYVDNAKAFDSLKKRDNNHNVVSTCLNAAVQGASPEGTCMIALTIGALEDSWSDIEPEDYVKVKNQFALQAIETFEDATGCKIQDAIEEFEMATPVTLSRYMYTPQGNIYGYLMYGWDGILSRGLTIEEDNNRVPGLKFAGAHGYMGMGFSSSYFSGNLIANMSIEAIKEGK